MFNPDTSALPGGAQTGFTSPTYDLTVDVPPNSRSEQWAITGIGGTQSGVTAHSVSSPFTLTVERSANIRTLPPVNSNGVLPSIPRNVYTVRVRKGVTPLSGQPAAIAMAELKFSIPAGADVADPANIRAMVSLLLGALSDQSAGLGTMLIDGVL